MSDWRKPLAPHDEGEVGRVYYINCMLVLKNGEEWTKFFPISLNPEQGSTIEEMLKRSQNLTKDMKTDLLSRRITENVLTNGNVLKIWISAEKAPDYWDPTHDQRVRHYMKESSLIDPYGNPIRH